MLEAGTHLTVESMLPVMTCGSDSWHLTSEMVAVWPARTWTCAFVRMSQTCKARGISH